MYTTIHKEWLIFLPDSLVREIGAGEGDTLECHASDGGIILRLAPNARGKKST